MLKQADVTGQPEQSGGEEIRTGQSWQDSHSRKDVTGWLEKTRQDSWAGQHRQVNRGRTARIRQVGHDNKDRTTVAGKP